MDITFKTLGNKNKTISVPDGAYAFNIEWGGYSGSGVYLWYKMFGNDHCVKLSSTRWRVNMQHFSSQEAFKSLNVKTFKN